ncbi:MAG: ice-binding family protein [Candidatus Shapirobacteria bacterium]|nr:ice-binding family protein [Candidatus Shapirobacteria bacterium]
MKILKQIKFIVLLLIILMGFIFTPVSKVSATTSRVDLLTADGFAVLGGSAISDTPTSTINGNVGLNPNGGASITGLTCNEVTGTIYDNNGAYTGNPSGVACRITDAGLLTQAKNDLTTAVNDANGRSVTSTIATELGGATLTDGVYNSAAGTFGITGTLTLDGQGNADSVFIFKAASTLITASSSKVVLINSAQACNIYWVVGSSATFGTSSTLRGNVMASESITDDGSSTIYGRLLASTAAITLNKTTVTKQTCAAGTSGGPALTSTSNTSSGTAIAYCPSIVNTVVPPIIIESKRVDKDSIYIKWGPYSGTDTFNVQYGTENGKWLYNVDVTGFSTTINALPINRPIWVQVAARNLCQIGTYGESKFVGSPKLPNTGFAPHKNSLFIFINQIKNWFL